MLRSIVLSFFFCTNVVGQSSQPIATTIQSHYDKFSNEQKFDLVRELKLPLGQYAITWSGPLGIRNLRKIHDIDLIVTAELWDQLAPTYSVKQDTGVRRIVLFDGLIEIFCDDWMQSPPTDKVINARIAQAEIIDGLPFEPLNTIVFFKSKLGRDKDLQDIALIEEYLNSNKNSL